MSSLASIRQLGCTVIHARNMAAMHRTLFLRDPDGNVLEIYAEI